MNCDSKCIYVCVYFQDDKERGTTMMRRVEKNWLGTIKIPFSTIYFNGRVSRIVYNQLCLCSQCHVSAFKSMLMYWLKCVVKVRHTSW